MNPCTNHSFSRRSGMPINQSKTMSQQPIPPPTPSSYQGVIDYCCAVLTLAVAVTRYPFCVLLSAIGWCGALANILHYTWFLGRLLQVNGRLPDSAFESLLPAFLCAAVAAIAWHFREKR